ncbi:MAG: Unknown protein [uncultured Thiotrichaceae bacterium]|uniref:CheW-like domain-containing protein n=1 Tax=uncultured Thiotrichaceae bacterium TaxID=298394 RepID=A0A6S6TSZ5_9GAMM|nr:MAG: Unknown protein [uncultured Thiotrichaceae bacterium]
MSLLMDIQCHVLPIEQGNLLIPSSLVVDEIVVDVTSETHEFSWRNRTIKLVSYSEVRKAASEAKQPYRAVVLRSLSTVKELPFYALAIEGFSHSVTANQNNLVLSDQKTCEITTCAAKIGSLVCMIPDLPMIEQRVLSCYYQSTLVSA